jgi:hypothetical protein
MKRRGKEFVALLAYFSLVAGAAAQMGRPGMMGPPAIQGVWNPVVGAGAVYESTNEKQEKRLIEISIVGKESVNGKDAYWMEFGREDFRTGDMVYAKMLLSPKEGNVVMERTIVQIPGQPQPVEFTSQFPSRREREPQAADFRQKAERVGTEAVTVPAGTFTCEHWQMKDGSGDVWLNEKVAPWGLVKTVGKERSMVLTRTITDAKTHITGKPISMEEMMQQRMQRPQ